jgi:hypothetical protein
MQTKDVQASEEKRAYYRLLRYLVTDELQAFYHGDQAQPSQGKDLPKGLAHYELSGIH